MKKILLSLLLAAGLLSSCDMQKDPVGTLNGKEPFAGMTDASRYRNVIYANIRSVTTSGYFTDPEIQMDMFQATNQIGNRGLVYASGDILPTSGEPAAYFSGLLLNVGSINYFLEKMKQLISMTEDEDELVEYRRFVAEAKFTRAFFNVLLFDRYCPLYTAETADAPALGIPIFETYNPTSDRTTYVGRSTQNESLAFIKKDLDEALAGLLEWEANDRNSASIVSMSPYVNSNVVKALQARLALLIGDYATARDKANEVINTGKYALATYAAYARMWSEDNGTEIIFRPFMSTNELSGSLGSRWLSPYSDEADYVPTQTCLNLYQRRSDARYNAFFETRDLNFEGEIASTLVFNKFPGNPSLKVYADDMYNMPKVFRTSELYLIVAESEYELKNETEANKALNALRTARIRNYSVETYTGSRLIEEIRTERAKELIGEGFRMSDLRRWHLAMSRSNPQADVAPYLWQSTVNVSYFADSHKFTWPIPQSELQVNPQMAGQQNPGY